MGRLTLVNCGCSQVFVRKVFVSQGFVSQGFVSKGFVSQLSSLIDRYLPGGFALN